MGSIRVTFGTVLAVLSATVAGLGETGVAQRPAKHPQTCELSDVVHKQRRGCPFPVEMAPYYIEIDGAKDRCNLSGVALWGIAEGSRIYVKGVMKTSLWGPGTLHEPPCNMQWVVWMDVSEVKVVKSPFGRGELEACDGPWYWHTPEFRIYDIRDLVHSSWGWGMNPGPFCDPDACTRHFNSYEDVVGEVKAHTTEPNWDGDASGVPSSPCETPVGRIQFQRGKILVWHYRYVQVQIETFLRQFRKTKGIDSDNAE